MTFEEEKKLSDDFESLRIKYGDIFDVELVAFLVSDKEVFSVETLNERQFYFYDKNGKEINIACGKDWMYIEDEYLYILDNYWIVDSEYSYGVTKYRINKDSLAKIKMILTI